MDAEDDKSEICGFAARLMDVAQLYEQAADKVAHAETAAWIRTRTECRRQMAETLLAHAGLSGEPSSTPLPLPEAVWMKASSLLSGSDGAVLRPLRSADRALLVAVTDYLDHSAPSGRAASAAEWLRERLERDVGPGDTNVAPPVQSG